MRNTLLPEAEMKWDERQVVDAIRLITNTGGNAFRFRIKNSTYGISKERISYILQCLKRKGVVRKVSYMGNWELI